MGIDHVAVDAEGRDHTGEVIAILISSFEPGSFTSRFDRARTACPERSSECSSKTAAGELDLRTGVPATADSLLQIGSVTKLWRSTPEEALLHRTAVGHVTARGTPEPASFWNLPASHSNGGENAVFHHELVARGAESGFSEAGGADIAERIGMSYRTIHRYFPCEEDVLLGLVIEGNHAFLERVGDRLGAGPPLSRSPTP